MTDTPTVREGDNAFVRLRRRKVVQWGLGYVASAWALLQGIAFFADVFGWPHQSKRIASLLLLVGLPIVLVLAWYHGDRGQQRITRPELAWLVVLGLLGGGVLWFFGNGELPVTTTSTTGTAAQLSPTIAASTDARPSIAVLPFDNRSKLDDDAYFVDGIHDDILTQLSKISALKVISRTSVEQFRDTKLAVKDIASQLGVKSVLEGGVQRAGDRVRITVQLINAVNDAHVWAETYDRELTAANIFEIQSEVAAAVAGALNAALAPAEKARAGVVPTRHLEAWEAYQLGRQRLARRTSEALLESESFFRKAIELDPDFALAYTGLATALSLLPFYGDMPFFATQERAQATVATALQLDPELPEAWVSSAVIAYHLKQYDRADPLFRRAIELDPNNAMAFKWYGQMLVDMLRIDEGQRALERAADLDPLSAIIQTNWADALQRQGRFPEAAAQYRRAIEIDPSTPLGYGSLGHLLAYAMNRFEVALPLLQRAVELDPDSPAWTMSLANLYLDLGNVGQFVATTGQAAGRWPDDSDVQFSLAVVNLLGQDRAAMVRHAQRSLILYPRHGGALVLLRDADLESGRYEDALARYQKGYPELFVQGVPGFNSEDYGVAVDLALVLQKRGDTARGNALLDGAAKVLGKLPRLGTGGYSITDVQIHALRGDKVKALAALREAQTSGWRSGWRHFRDFEPNLESIRNEPEFKSIFADIERDMARQRAAVAARPKDAPLELEAAGT